MYEKSDVGNRIMAGLIDMVIAWIPAMIIPGLGGLLGVAYILTKDTIVYQITNEEKWKNISIGKNFFNLKVENLEGDLIDYTLSAKRNLPLCIGSIISVVPVIGWILGGIVGFVVAIIELILIVNDDRGQRLGDRFAQTQVVNVDQAEEIIEETENPEEF